MWKESGFGLMVADSRFGTGIMLSGGTGGRQGSVSEQGLGYVSVGQGRVATGALMNQFSWVELWMKP